MGQKVMKRYPAYKDSGIEWIGQIPSHWNIKRLKYLDKTIMGQSPESTDCNKEGVGIPFLQGNADFSGLNPMPSVWCNHPNKLAQKDDILLSVRAPVGAVNVADQTYGIGRGLCAIRPKYSHKKYSYYRALCLLDELNRIATGSTYTAVAVDQVNSVVVPNSAYDEQGILSNYLDRKTAQIDDLIAKKERMIGFLKEERTAIINQAVTKGLDPKVEMKDSGIEWLGKISNYWSLKKIKYVARVNSMTLPETTENNYEFRYVDIGNVDLEEGFNIGEKINFVNAPSRARRIVRKGDTIVSTVRTYLKAIAYFENDIKDIIVSTGFAVVAPQQRIILKFLYYVLRSEKFIDRVCTLSVGVSYPAINSTELSDIAVWYPEDTKEQLKIVKYLDRVVAKTKLIISQVYSEVSLLKEYRAALVSEAVTGKIDVRG